MRVTRKQAETNRQKILDSAIRLFAERGVNGVGIAEVMADAGFTHGGFYNHFGSKDDLVLEVCSTSFARAAQALRDGRRPPIGARLSAAMLGEAPNGSAALSAVSAKGVNEFLDVLTDRYGERDRAAAALAGMVGARLICRAVQQADKGLADQFAALDRPPDG
jgi:TetR/AcrR family transcriptional regulator, transcriptional repressor for nem operon